LEKAIDIKRRAQRCLQSGDLDGALSEYEKLTHADDSEPINFVLLADLLFKKGESAEAARRYLEAVDAYGKTGLYKNAIAVCKKMMRLSLSPAVVLQRLAELHALDGLSTEAALYYQEYAEYQAHEQRYREAAESLRRAYQVSPESVRVLEKASAWLLEAGDTAGAAEILLEASRQYARDGKTEEAERLQGQAESLRPAAEEQFAAQDGVSVGEPAANAPAAVTPVHEAEVTPGSIAGLETHPTFEAPALEARHYSEAEPEPDAAEAVVDEPVQPVEVVDEPAAGHHGAGEVTADVTPPAPSGLHFGTAPKSAAPAGSAELAEIEDLLRQAAERYKRGEREWAGDALVRAAKAYEAIDRLESAAAIYRSLGRSTQTTPEVMGLWLRNCELRSDAREAAEVACALGDHSINDGDMDGAREWFTRALRHMPEHETAKRRLQRLGPRPPEPAPTANGAQPAPPENAGRVEVAVGRAQAVTLDLSSLLAEFQQGIEAQLSGDAQSHYDLGVTYREMGLLEQAVERFRAAAQDPAFHERCAEMIGRCLLDQGRFDEAAEEFERALESLSGKPEAGVSLRFQLGLAHEVAGRPQEALAEFERVYAAQPNYPDVAQKIRVLRRTPESV
jgi:tetratricopeptide (TPR) repeat protein